MSSIFIRVRKVKVWEGPLGFHTLEDSGSTQKRYPIWVWLCVTTETCRWTGCYQQMHKGPCPCSPLSLYRYWGRSQPGYLLKKWYWAEWRRIGAWYYCLHMLSWTNVSRSLSELQTNISYLYHIEGESVCDSHTPRSEPWFIGSTLPKSRVIFVSVVPQCSSNAPMFSTHERNLVLLTWNTQNNERSLIWLRNDPAFMHQSKRPDTPGMSLSLRDVKNRVGIWRGFGKIWP